MATIVRSVEVERPASAVWAVLEDVRHIPVYSPSTVAVTGAPDRITETGQRFRQAIVVLGRCFESEWVITELRTGQKVAMEGSIGVGSRYCLVEEVDPQGPERSRLTVRITFAMPGGLLGRVAEGLGAQRRAQREAEQVLANLKAHLERNTETQEDAAGRVTHEQPQSEG